MKEIILIGSYQTTKQLNRFITSVQQEFKIVVRYVLFHYYNILTSTYRLIYYQHPFSDDCFR